jgi:predicted transcriptional regulator
MKTVVDWGSKPEPWRSIGPEFKAEVEAIASTEEWVPALRRRIAAAGLTLSQAAEIAGISQPSLSQLPERKVPPRWDMRRAGTANDGRHTVYVITEAGKLALSKVHEYFEEQGKIR